MALCLTHALYEDILYHDGIQAITRKNYYFYWEVFFLTEARRNFNIRGNGKILKCAMS